MIVYPHWFAPFLGGHLPSQDGDSIVSNGVPLACIDGLLRDESCSDAKQAQTRSTFAFKWQREDSYGSPPMHEMSRQWLSKRYEALWDHDVWSERGEKPSVLDAGCGSAYSAQLLFDKRFDRIHYVGVDLSRAVDVAARAFEVRGIDGAFLQADLMSLPFADESFDVVFSEGVLHHTPDTRAALASVVGKLRKGGVIAFYVYRRKSPVREFTDDLIRERVSDLPPEQAWDLLMPLSKLGAALGKLNASVDIEEDVGLLGIPAGQIDVQRLFYWHICKMFFHEQLSINEMNHINFDWFTPKYAHRQSEEELRSWCCALDLRIESLIAEDAGITVVATRGSSR